MKLVAIGAVILCWGTPEQNIIGVGRANRRTLPYARQDALVNAKDDGIRQCYDRKQDFEYDKLDDEDCTLEKDGFVTCRVSVCGHCKTRYEDGR